jgi:chemotaxis methyl-accepting protein methylase
LEHVEEGETSNNLTKVIMKVVTNFTNMFREDSARQMLSFGAGKFHLPCCMSLLENACSYHFLCTVS